MKNKKKVLIIGIALLIVLIGLLAIILANKFSKNREFIGSWTTDGVTVYQFKRNYKGSLVVPLGEYPFTYEINGDKIFIDFENEKSTDSEFTYSFEDDKLILKGVNGTFTFTRKIG